jgi:hypothetical protein
MRMERWAEKPLKFGEVLDVIFRIMKQHFLGLFMIMLVLLGPLYLVQGLSLLLGGANFFRDTTKGPWYNTIMDPFLSGDPSMELGSATIIAVIITSLILFIVSFPVASAAIILAIDKVRKGEAIEVSGAIRGAFSRFFPLIGASIVYMLIFVGSYIGLVLIIFLMIGAAGMTTGFTGDIFPGFLSIIGLILLSIVLIFPFIYFMTRWGFYFPATTMDKVSPGLTSSWRLTRKNFWRLIGLFIVISILTSLISVAFQLLVGLIFGASVLGSIFTSLFTMITYLIYMIAYGVVYFDLKVRNEATDIMAIVESYENKIDPEAQPQSQDPNQ